MSVKTILLIVLAIFAISFFSGLVTRAFWMMLKFGVLAAILTGIVLYVKSKITG
jgi:hypothetical protein